MKKIYKLIGLLSLNFSNNFAMENSDCDSDYSDSGTKWVNTKPININPTCKISPKEVKEISSEVKSLLNFFELMDVTLNLDFNNYKEYKQTLEYYNNYIIKKSNSKDNLVPLLNEKGYKRYLNKYNTIREKKPIHYINLKNNDNYLIMDINSGLMNKIIKNVNWLNKQLMGSEIRIEDFNIYEDIFFGHKIFNSFKGHLVNEDSEIKFTDVKAYIDGIKDLIDLMNDYDIYDNKKIPQNLIDTLKYFQSGLKDLTLPNSFSFKDLSDSDNFLSSTHTHIKENEIGFLLKQIFKNIFEFNHSKFICPGLTELLIFKKDNNETQMDFKKLNKFIFNYWNELILPFKKIEIIKNGDVNQKVNDLLTQLNKSDFHKNFDKNVKELILANNKEIILDSREMLLNVYFNKGEDHIFFINMEFVNTLLECDSQENINLDKEISSLRKITGEEVGLLENNIVNNCLKGVLYSDIVKIFLNPILKHSNKGFITFLEELKRKLKTINTTNEIKLKLDKLTDNLLTLNKNMREQTNVKNIIGLSISENHESNTIFKSLDSDGGTNKEITLNRNECSLVYNHENNEKIKDFAQDIFQIN
jgi:hypothetical protein